MAVSIALGCLGVLISVVCWGTWASVLKTERVRKSHIDSLVIQVR